MRFSEQLDELYDLMFEANGWKPDNNKPRHMPKAFAWLSGDKPMSDYRPANVDEYVRRLVQIAKGFDWGRLRDKGAMAEPYDHASCPPLPSTARRSDRPSNNHLTKLQAASNVLKKSYRLHRQGFGQVMNF